MVHAKEDAMRGPWVLVARDHEVERDVDGTMSETVKVHGIELRFYSEDQAKSAAELVEIGLQDEDWAGWVWWVTPELRPQAE